MKLIWLSKLAKGGLGPCTKAPGGAPLLLSSMLCAMCKMRTALRVPFVKWFSARRCHIPMWSVLQHRQCLLLTHFAVVCATLESHYWHGPEQIGAACGQSCSTGNALLLQLCVLCLACHVDSGQVAFTVHKLLLYTCCTYSPTQACLTHQCSKAHVVKVM